MYVGSPSVNVVDTVGCGDSAAAAIVLGYLNIHIAKRKAVSESEDLSKERVLEMLGRHWRWQLLSEEPQL